MLFPTTVFAIFFLVIFHLHWSLEGFPRARKGVLLAASLFFYGYWSWKFALMLLLSTMVNHALARQIERAGRHGGVCRSRPWLVGAIVFNLGLLGSFKYAGFVVGDLLFPLMRPCCLWLGPDAVNWLVGVQEEVYPWLSKVVLPVGISFFTFQALSYVMDVYRGRTAPARTWLDFANYLAFFPQLVAGPIVRAEDLVPQMEQMPRREVRIDAGRAGFLILSGLFKKTVVANWLAARLADPVFAWPEAYSGPDVLMGVYGYAIQIYCDFSAYSDIAIGTALLLGFHFPDNFHAPYLATSLQDFWRRWHISLSTWLRDYLYIPLGGSRGTLRRTQVNLLITFLLGGLWHGAAWTFIWWGAFHGFYLILERAVFARVSLPVGRSRISGSLLTLAARLWIFHVVCASWLLFRAGNLETLGGLVRSLLAWRSAVPEVTLWGWLPLLVLAAGFSMQGFDGNRLERITRRLADWPGWVLGVLAAVILTIILALGPEGVAPFIYFQF